MPNWYVLTVQSRRELAAHEMLQERGVMSMVPLEHFLARPSRRSKRRELRSRPLMFGYLFLEAEGELPWQDIHDVPGVRGFISQGGAPYALPPADVERLLAMSSVMAPDDDPDRHLKPGDYAQIVNGPFAGRIVKVADIVGQKARTLLQLFGSMKTIEIPVSALRAA